MVIGSLRMEIRWVDDVPTEWLRRWRIGTRKSVSKTDSARRAAVGTEADFRKKIAEPLLKVFPHFLNPDYSKYTKTASIVIENLRQELLNSAPRYLFKLDKFFRTIRGVKAKAYKNRVEQKIDNYRWALKYLLPLTYARYPQKSIVSLATMFLTATPKIHKRYLGQSDKMNGSAVLITSPEKTGRLKKVLNNQILRWGTRILKVLYLAEILSNGLDNLLRQPKTTVRGNLWYQEQMVNRLHWLDEYIIEANQSLNNLAEQYRIRGFTPFKPGADSHIDFVLEKRREPPILDRYTYHLYLDIQVSKPV